MTQDTPPNTGWNTIDKVNVTYFLDTARGMAGCGALVHAMPAPTVLLPSVPWVKGLYTRPSTNHRSQPWLNPAPHLYCRLLAKMPHRRTFLPMPDSIESAFTTRTPKFIHAVFHRKSDISYDILLQTLWKHLFRDAVNLGGNQPSSSVAVWRDTFIRRKVSLPVYQSTLSITYSKRPSSLVVYPVQTRCLVGLAQKQWNSRPQPLGVLAFLPTPTHTHTHNRFTAL